MGSVESVLAESESDSEPKWVFIRDFDVAHRPQRFSLPMRTRKVDRRDNRKVYSSGGPALREITNTTSLEISRFLENGTTRRPIMHCVGGQRNSARSSRSDDLPRDAVVAAENQQACRGGSGVWSEHQGKSNDQYASIRCARAFGS